MCTFRRPRLPMMALLLIGLCLAMPNLTHAAGLFGQTEIRANRITSIPKWVALMERAKADVAVLKQCLDRVERCPDQAARAWRTFARAQLGKPRQTQLAAVHRYMNQWRYITDDRLYGVRDYWATPLEFMNDSGDCEDYAIAKYYTLKILGWNDADLRLVIVQDTVRGIPHAVLSVKVRDGGDTTNMILDNLLTEPLSDKYLMQYTPYYAVNETTRWTFIRPIR